MLQLTAGLKNHFAGIKGWYCYGQWSRFKSGRPHAPVL